MTGEGRRRTRLDEQDRALLRTLGAHISQIIHGEDLDVPDVRRRDELGILANMLSRLARELSATRRREREQRAELERRVEQLQTAYDTQEKLLASVRRLSSPILEPYPGVLLLPIVGVLDAANAVYVMPALLERIAADSPQVVIIHVPFVDWVTPDVAALVRHAKRAARPLRARVLVSGVTPAAARKTGIEVSDLTLFEDLCSALSAALDLMGYRITR
jgi:rsbT co-antagonist protein RsbR